MTQNWNQPPRQPQPTAGDGRPPGASRGRGLWWVIVGVAAVVLVGLLALAVLRPGPPGPEETPTVSPTPSSEVSTEPGTTTPETTSPGEPETTAPEPGSDWGPYPPPNADSLRDISAPEFPETLGSFTLADSRISTFDASAGYRDTPNATDFSVSIFFQAADYRDLSEQLADPVFVGDALCGLVVSEFSGEEQPECLMAGAGETLWVRSSTVPLEELGELTQELYESL